MDNHKLYGILTVIGGVIAFVVLIWLFFFSSASIFSAGTSEEADTATTNSNVNLGTTNSAL